MVKHKLRTFLIPVLLFCLGFFATNTVMSCAHKPSIVLTDTQTQVERDTTYFSKLKADLTKVMTSVLKDAGITLKEVKYWEPFVTQGRQHVMARTILITEYDNDEDNLHYTDADFFIITFALDKNVWAVTDASLVRTITIKTEPVTDAGAPDKGTDE